MTTYREVIYMCLDILRGTSDDFSYTEEHLGYLIDKFRAILLRELYGKDPKKHVPYSNYQSIKVSFDTDTNDKKRMLKSKTQIPYMLQLGIPRIVSSDDEYYNYRFELVSRERLPFVGNNKFTNMITYCAINEDNHVLTPNKESYWSEEGTYIGPTEFNIVGIFENPREVTDETSFKETSSSDWKDKNIPLEEALITSLIDKIVSSLVKAVVAPSDTINNGTDENAAIPTKMSSDAK